MSDPLLLHYCYKLIELPLQIFVGRHICWQLARGCFRLRGTWPVFWQSGCRVHDHSLSLCGAPVFIAAGVSVYNTERNCAAICDKQYSAHVANGMVKIGAESVIPESAMGSNPTRLFTLVMDL